MPSESNRVQRLHIVISRVQTWLFAAPRLRAMVGANALLGETLRCKLPELAREEGRGWELSPTPSSELFPKAEPNDPLNDPQDPNVHDDPAADASSGILARDGGHFEALFKNGAEAFAGEAGRLLRSNLPGLRFSISIDGERHGRSQNLVPKELPVLAPCQWMGRGLASNVVPQGNKADKDSEVHEVSIDAKQRHEAAKRAEKWQTKDVASVLSSRTALKELKRPQEFQELVGDGYLALIHADGNEVGAGLRNSKSDNQRAEFYHRNRVLLRRAVAEAINCACEKDKPRRTREEESAKTNGREPKIFAPLIPLMLGGDDLLLVTRAETALPFVVELCAELKALQDNVDATDFKLTLGVGVVIAKHTIPIHRLHEVAEQLASSAKRRYRGLDADKKCSVVDWAVFTTAWVDDPAEVRRRNWLRGSENGLRILSQRPLDVLGEQRVDALQGLVKGAQQLADAPRSQLRYLVEQLRHGRALSELAFEELPPEVKDQLDKAGMKELWRPAGNASITALLDLVEVSEISRLGRNSEEEGAHV